MSEFKGTPAPWRLKQGERKAMISGKSWTNLAKVITDTILVGESEEYKESEIGKANATLIAYAPQILEMLKEIITHADSIVKKDDNSEASEAYYQVINRAEQLIQQATTIK